MKCKPQVLDAIGRHGAETYPEECCGFLLGERVDGENVVLDLYRVANTDSGERRRRYTISPRDYMQADRAADGKGRDIVGIYHSHPDHPARPSKTDLAEATFPGFSYVIVSVLKGKPSDLTAWSLADDRSRFDPEPVDTTPDTSKKNA